MLQCRGYAGLRFQKWNVFVSPNISTICEASYSKNTNKGALAYGGVYSLHQLPS